MKKLIPVMLILLTAASCILFPYIKGEGDVYVLDWSAEAVYVMDTTYAITGPLLLTGTSPSDIFIDNDEIFISNSGFGGTPLVQKFDMEGNELASYECSEASSPAGIAAYGDYVFAALWGSSEILVLNRQDLSMHSIIPVKDEPYTIFIYNDKLYIGTSGYSEPAHYVYTLNPGNMTLDSIETGNNPTYFYEYNTDIYVSCTGNIFTGIGGDFARIRGNAVDKRFSTEHNPDRFTMDYNAIIAIETYLENDIAKSNIFVMDVDSQISGTISVDGAAEIFQYKNKIHVLNNNGAIYIADIPSLTIIDTIELSKELKSTRLIVYN